MRNLSQYRTLGIGLLIIMIGLAFLFRQMNIFPYQVENILFTWQMLLIVIGLFALVFGENKITGFILLIVGGFFLLPEVYYLPYNFKNTFWPVLLILVGIFILFKSGLYRSRAETEQNKSTRQMIDYIDEVNIFSGGERRISVKNFRGGKITSIFGGSELDLTGSTLSTGTNALEVFYMFGGSSIRVPDDWVVINRVTAILGGFSDKRAGQLPQEDISEKTLIVRGFIMFGGGEIKN